MCNIGAIDNPAPKLAVGFMRAEHTLMTCLYPRVDRESGQPRCGSDVAVLKTCSKVVGGKPFASRIRVDTSVKSKSKLYT